MPPVSQYLLDPGQCVKKDIQQEPDDDFLAISLALRILKSNIYSLTAAKQSLMKFLVNVVPLAVTCDLVVPSVKLSTGGSMAYFIISETVSHDSQFGDSA